MRFPPANMPLRRAQLVLMLAVLLPTIAMTAVGIVLLVLSRTTTTLISGVLVLTFCTSGITGYILVAIVFEKPDLLAHFGADYRAWRARTPLFIPRFGSRAPSKPRESGMIEAA